MRIYLYAFLLLLISCQQNPKQNQELLDINENQIKKVTESEDVKMMFYNVPSPVEMAQIIKKSNVKYNPELLNPYENVDNYTTTEDLAMNLGIYGADLSYNRMFDQMQESIKYFSAIRKISDELKIPTEEGGFTISRFEKNIDNRDSLIYIISDTYANADIYLKENQRGQTANLIVLGGWIEALYISINLISEKNPNPFIIERIAEQKFSAEHLSKLINTDNYKSQKINSIINNLSLLESTFNKLNLSYSTGEIKTDSISKSTIIEGKTNISVSYDEILEIKEIIVKIRNLIIGKS